MSLHDLYIHEMRKKVSCRNLTGEQVIFGPSIGTHGDPVEINIRRCMINAASESHIARSEVRKFSKLSSLDRCTLVANSLNLDSSIQYECTRSWWNLLTGTALLKKQ